MTDALTPLLLDAKKEYTMRLCEVMSPFVIDFIDSTYRNAKKEAGDRRALIEFQERLRQVPTWNSSIISQLTRDIETKYSYFSDLIAAVFVTYVKVLSSIKISSQRPNIKLKLPTNDAFVHQVYVFASKNFYENPYAVQESQQAKTSHVLNAIETAVRTMLPLGDVLQAYLSSTVNEDNTLNPVLSPAQSDDEEPIEDPLENQKEETTPAEQESSDSESDFDETEEKIIQQPTISPINRPYPSSDSPDTTHDFAAAPPNSPAQTAPPISSFLPGGTSNYQPATQTAAQTAPPTPSPYHRPLFADATDGEQQFR